MNTKDIISIPFFFVTGRPRSGTTLLRMLFDAHPNVTMPPESAWLKYSYPKYGKVRNWDKEQICIFLNDFKSQNLIAFWQLDMELLKSHLLNNAGNYSYGEFCKLIYVYYKSLYNKETIKLIGDKNPPYTLFTDKLIKIFPEAKFVHITRDYRDNILSMLRVDFERPWVSSLAYRWKYYNKTLLNVQRRFPEKFLLIKYEDLVTNPEDKFREICTFLKIEFTLDVLNFNSIKDKITDASLWNYINKYHQSLYEPISPKKVDEWKLKMKESDIKKADLIAGKFAETLGYARKYTKFNLPLYIYCLPGIIYGRLYYMLFDVIYAVFPYSLRVLFSKISAFLFNPLYKKIRK